MKDSVISPNPPPHKRQKIRDNQSNPSLVNSWYTRICILSDGFPITFHFLLKWVFSSLSNHICSSRRMSCCTTEQVLSPTDWKIKRVEKEYCKDEEIIETHLQAAAGIPRRNSHIPSTHFLHVNPEMGILMEESTNMIPMHNTLQTLWSTTTTLPTSHPTLYSNLVS